MKNKITYIQGSFLVAIATLLLSFAAPAESSPSSSSSSSSDTCESKEGSCCRQQTACKLVKDVDWALSFNIGHLFFGAYDAQFEIKANNFLSIIIPFGAVSPAWSLSGISTTRDIEGWAVGAGIGLRFYPIGYPLDRGLYVQADVGIGGGSQPTSGAGPIINANAPDSAFQLAWFYDAHVGYMWVTNIGLTLDIAAGFSVFDAEVPSEIPDRGFINFNRLAPDVRFLFGFAI